MLTIKDTTECFKECPRQEQFVNMARENISLEEVEKFYNFLQGEVPEELTLQSPPKLTADQAFTVVYYLQEIFQILPDKYEKCLMPECNALFDSENEGCAALFCDSCGCQYPKVICPCESCPADV